MLHAPSNHEEDRYRGKQFAQQINFQQWIDELWMPVVDTRERIAHLFGPDCHHQKPQRRIVQAVIMLIRIMFHAVVEREIAPTETWPRISSSIVRRYAAR